MREIRTPGSEGGQEQSPWYLPTPSPEAVPRRRAGQWSPYFLLFLLVARRKKTPSRGGEAWEGVFGQRARHGETKASLLTFSSQLS